MNFLIKNFLRGLAILVPIVVTVYVVGITFVRIDRLVAAPYPGVGVAITIAFIIAVGTLTSNFVGRALLELTENLFRRAPIVKIIYTSIKDLIDAFVGDKKRFDKPVVVELTSLGDAKAIGFVTRDDLSALGLAGEVAVYFPQSYNFAGNLLIVPRARVTPLNADSSQVMAFVVSGGVSGLREKEAD